MALNVFTLLQVVFFVAIVFDANLHSVAAESKTSADGGSGKSIEVNFCETNCTRTNEGWVGCTGGCFCVHVSDRTEGQCMNLEGGDYEDNAPPEEED
uniref:Putative secreted protein n=1 Tax=Ixodes ricinus TaxID=34613 RepID=A0A090X999_IXORI